MAKQQITLSPEALAALRLPLKASPYGRITDANGEHIATVNLGLRTLDYPVPGEIAAALAQLINAAFTPAAEPAPEVCRMGDCMMDAAPASLYCAEHRVAVQRELS